MGTLFPGPANLLSSVPRP